jgi:hypothetical protein
LRRYQIYKRIMALWRWHMFMDLFDYLLIGLRAADAQNIGVGLVD